MPCRRHVEGGGRKGGAATAGNRGRCCRCGRGTEEECRAEGLQQDDRDVPGSVGADDKGLLDVGGLGGAGDEAAEVVGVEVLPGVGFVHVAYDLLSVQQDDEGFGDE